MNTATANEPIGNSPVALPYLTRVSGRDAAGRKFKDYALLDNIGTTGLSVRLSHSLTPGMKLSVAVRLSLQPEWQVSAQYLVARCQVIRVEPQADGTSGVAVSFTRCRFI